MLRDSCARGVSKVGHGGRRLPPPPPPPSSPPLVSAVSRAGTLLCTLGEAPLTDEELDELLRLADPDGTGFCTLDKFRSLPCWKLPDMPAER